ncbi:hypothetical protein CSKR_109833 [Clonorchis sinensis]|uniref:ABC transporter related protein n=2 Tax=Clonorchis sinensis TaxID=79923 RepID=F2VT61_CLOSI|nr:ABC transporter related protein precursor [Clonorchis sinensis]KAG5441463.1 hypothetical protein CSKR_109833 [Clonorchis sinensis]GAA53386.1 ABC transporter related protein precursor [Clonorchis sinensis]
MSRRHVTRLISFGILLTLSTLAIDVIGSETGDTDEATTASEEIAVVNDTITNLQPENYQVETPATPSASNTPPGVTVPAAVKTTTEASASLTLAAARTEQSTLAITNPPTDAEVQSSGETLVNNQKKVETPTEGITEAPSRTQPLTVGHPRTHPALGTFSTVLSTATESPEKNLSSQEKDSLLRPVAMKVPSLEKLSMIGEKGTGSRVSTASWFILSNVACFLGYLPMWT